MAPEASISIVRAHVRDAETHLMYLDLNSYSALKALETIAQDRLDSALMVS